MNDSTLLIQSQNSKNSSMGTGFVIYLDTHGCYVLTCHHVLKAVQNPKIDNYEIEVISTSDIYDLALLYVKGLEREALVLREVYNQSRDRDVSFIGYYIFKMEGEFRRNQREAKIFDRGTHKRGEKEFEVWEIIAKEDNYIVSGYSGSPLLLNGEVIGVITNKNRSQSNRGFATSIQYLLNIWEHPPADFKLLASKKENPFVGLRAFSDTDGKYFFGRDREVNEIIERLKHHNFLALIGDSGSGKSSIVKAKVIPYYLESNYFVLQMRPANNPYLELSNQLKQVVRPEDKELVLRMLHAFAQEKKTTLLFYIDQFEELFTSTSTENRDSFLDLILYLHKNETTQLKIEIVFTMRSDYYPLLKQYKVFTSLIEQNREENKYVIQRMGNEELKETIYKPLLSVNLVKEDEAKTFAEFVVQSMGIKSNEITLLQIAMTQTWRFLEEGKGLFDAYEKADGVSGALQKLAKETIEAVGEEELLKTIFMRLIHFDRDGNHTRRVVSKSEFRANQWKLVQRLSSALNEQGEVAKGEAEKLGRLLKLSKSDTDEEQSVELVHEALILGWRDYVAWIGELSLFKVVHDVVIEKSREYYAKKRGRSFLLMGADLAKASHLLDDEYRAFLSDDERKYIQKSLGYNSLIKNGIIFVLLLLLGTVGYLWYKAEKSKEEIIQVLQRSTNGASIVIQGNRLSNVRLITQPIVSQFKESKSVEIQRIVSQAWFVNARSFQRMKRDKKALNEYRELVAHFKNSKDKDVIRYVVQSLFNQGIILEKSSQKKEAIACFDRVVNEFKVSEELRKIEIVLFAWHKKISLLEDRNRQEREFLALIAYSKDITTTNKKIDKLISIAYGNLLEVLIFNHKYQEGLKIGEEEALKRANSMGIAINLAHLYLLSNQIERAKEIYLRYKKKKKNIENDFKKFKAEGINSKEFSKILELLSN